MKRLIYILLLLNVIGFSYLAYADGWFYSVANAPICDPATNEIGSRLDTGTDTTPGVDVAYVYAGSADCTGVLHDAYIYHNDTTDGTIYVAIYTKSDVSPQTGDALVGYAAITATTTTGWKSAASSGGNVTSGSVNYWVMVICATNASHFLRAGAT